MEANKLAKKQIKLDYKNYIDSYISKNLKKGNDKPLFRFISHHKSGSKNTHIPELQGNTQDTDIANCFAVNFESVFLKDDNTTPEFQLPKTFSSQETLEINVDGILKQLLSLDHTKGPGPDGIRPSLLKFLAPLIAEPLSSIFSYSLDTGSVPSDWKVARVVPVYKKGDRKDPLNYRPISLTCICCKIMEHVIAHSMREHLDNNNLINDCQHGFRARHSCESQLIHTLTDLAMHNNTNTQVDVLILDYSKAFDKVSHPKLLQKLQSYGFHPSIIDWLKSWLKSRVFHVNVNNSLSTATSTSSGVPQGSVLGPLLFLIYINDLPDCIQSSTTSVRLFADDIVLYSPIRSTRDQENLQEDLNNLVNWSNKWQLQLNVSKCSSTSINPIKFTYTYSISNVQISHSPQFKYLGILVCNDLSFCQHITSTIGKASGLLFMLMRVLKNASTQAKRLAYFTICIPVLEYASEIWSPHLKYQIDNIENVNRRAFRWVYSFKKYDRISDKMQELNWPTLQERRDQKDKNTLFKIYEGTLNVNYERFNLKNTNYNTRHGIIRHTINSDAMKYSFFNRTIPVLV
jgi:hypothetical protein